MNKADVNVKFEWISNTSGQSYVSIDKAKRLYISKDARDMLGLPHGHYRLLVGFDHVNKRVVLAKPEVIKPMNTRPFNFDGRSYSRASELVAKARISDGLPIRFYYAGKDFSEMPHGSHAFTLEGYESEDG